MKKNLKLYSKRAIYLLAICSHFLLACTFDYTEELQGIWSDAYTVFEIRNDTMKIYHYPGGSTRYIISIEEDEIFLLKNITNRFIPEGYKKLRYKDRLTYPYLYGQIQHEGVKNHENLKFFSYMEDNLFRKLNPKVIDPKLTKFQFSLIYSGYDLDFELDVLGNSLISKDDSDAPQGTYSVSLSTEDKKHLLNLLSYVQFDSIQPTYIFSDCSHMPTYSFSFFFDSDTLNTFIYCKPEHVSLLPLRYVLEEKTYRYGFSLMNYPKVEDHIFNSRLNILRKNTLNMNP